ncbi:hypothetical protein ACRAWF_18095 [Streptomyces sp. L7]
MIMVLGPHKKKTEAMAEATRGPGHARKAEAKANPGKSQNAAESDVEDENSTGEDIVDEVEAPAEASADA